jgi:Thioredoxin
VWSLQSHCAQIGGVRQHVCWQNCRVEGKLTTACNSARSQIPHFYYQFQVDVDECEDVAAEYNIASMPTFVFVKNSAKVDEFSGANADKLENTIKKLLNAV